MKKILRASILVLALTVSVFAGEIPNDYVPPTQQPPTTNISVGEIITSIINLLPLWSEPIRLDRLA
jgi:hypothetical protein